MSEGTLTALATVRREYGERGEALFRMGYNLAMAEWNDRLVKAAEDSKVPLPSSPTITPPVRELTARQRQEIILEILTTDSLPFGVEGWTHRDLWDKTKARGILRWWSTGYNDLDKLVREGWLRKRPVDSSTKVNLYVPTQQLHDRRVEKQP